MTEVFRALNDPIRRRILEMLRKGDLNAGDIAAAFDISKPSISHHLEQLRQADLVVSRKQGQFVVYSLNTSVLDEVLAWIYGLKGEELP
jgi:ArsR family transcriptional regulator, arsenate/arsenite/antimonite-responsive transcriptional repressor